MTATALIVAVLFVAGVVTVLVPVLPGTLMIAAGIVLWAAQDGSATAWTLAGAALLVLAVGAVVKYVVPGRRLDRLGIPTSTQVAGVLLGVVGFFVVPVLGLYLGFVLGVWLAELRRLGHTRAWASTMHALRAAGLSLLIELIAAALAIALTLIGMVVTA